MERGGQVRVAAAVVALLAVGLGSCVALSDSDDGVADTSIPADVGGQDDGSPTEEPTAESGDDSPEEVAAEVTQDADDRLLNWSFGFTDSEGWSYLADVSMSEAEFFFAVDVTNSPPGSARVVYELEVSEFDVTVEPNTPGRNPPPLPEGSSPLFSVILELPGPAIPWQTNVAPVGPCTTRLRVSSDASLDGYWEDVVDADRSVTCSLQESGASSPPYVRAGISEEMAEERANEAVALLNQANPIAYRVDFKRETNTTQACRFALGADGHVEAPFGSLGGGPPCAVDR